MKNMMKMKIISELNDHLENLSFADVKAMCDEAKAKSMGAESEGEEMDEMGKPMGGIAIEKVQVMKPKKEIPGMDIEPEVQGDEKEEMSDEELKELISKFMK